MKYLFSLIIVVLLSGCATWGGIKQDAQDFVDWTQEQFN